MFSQLMFAKRPMKVETATTRYGVVVVAVKPLSRLADLQL
jgi:hypothetical protein